MVKLARLRRSGPAPADTVDTPDTDTATVEKPQVSDDPADASEPPARSGRFATLRLLTGASHPRQAVLGALVMTVAAALSGRPVREAALVFATVLVGSLVLGWHNDLVDRRRDLRNQTAGKPIADGRLDSGTAWFALACGVLLLIPLTVTNGITAGSAYLVSVLLGVLGNVALRQGFLSWVTWAASYALLPAFLSYGGWGGQTEGDPPRILMTVLAALLGIGVHVLSSLWGLVPDDKDGWNTLPLRLGRRLGSSRLLIVTVSYLVVVSAAIVVSAATGGLVR